MCDSGCCILLARKSQHSQSHIDRIDSLVDVRYLVLYSLGQKSQHASSHIDRIDSLVDVRYLVLYSLGQKITTCIIAHRPNRFTTKNHSSMCDIGCCAFSKKITRCVSHIGRIDSLVDVRYRLLYSLVQKHHKMRIAHRPNFMLLKRRFWKTEQTFGNVFSKHFSNERSPNRVLTYVKSALKIRSRMFARPSKIFVWGA